MPESIKESCFAKEKAKLYFKVIKRAGQSIFKRYQAQRRQRNRESCQQDIRRVQSQIQKILYRRQGYQKQESDWI